MGQAATGEGSRQGGEAWSRCFTPNVLVTVTLLTFYLQIRGQVEAKCCVMLPEKWGKQLDFCSGRGGTGALLTLQCESWVTQPAELTAPCRRKHNLVKSPEFPSCSNSFSRERKGRSFFLIWLPSCVTLGCSEHAAVVEVPACGVVWSNRRQNKNLVREKQPLSTWELCGSHFVD